MYISLIKILIWYMKMLVAGLKCMKWPYASVFFLLCRDSAICIHKWRTWFMHAFLILKLNFSDAPFYRQILCRKAKIIKRNLLYWLHWNVGDKKCEGKQGHSSLHLKITISFSFCIFFLILSRTILLLILGRNNWINTRNLEIT